MWSRSLLDKILEQGDAAGEVHAEVFIQDDVSLHDIQRGAPDPSKQETNLGSWVDTHVSMSHQGLKDKVLAKVHQCVLLEVPLTLFAMVLNHVEHELSFTGHVTSVVCPQIVRVQQLVGKSTVSSLLCCLDDREGIIGEENLGKLLPHRRPIDNET